MANVQDPQFASLADRIAALNQAHVVSPSRPPSKKPPPPLPPTRPTLNPRSQTIDSPPTATTPPPTQRSKSTTAITNPPKLPSRTPPPLPSRKSSQAPALPPRAPLTGDRRASTDSSVSLASSTSTKSWGQSTASSASSIGAVSTGGRNLPPAYDQTTLPPLPPSRREQEAKTQQEADKKRAQDERAFKKPPLLPARTVPLTHTLPTRSNVEARPAMPSKKLSSTARASNAPRRLPPMPAPTVSQPELSQPELVQRQGNSQHQELQQPELQQPKTKESPPPIPRHSRPTTKQIDSCHTAVSTTTTAPPAAAGCLYCRDFSGPDQVATQYPRQSLPSNPTAYLARVLCGPFESPTDKARAIFTWLHHNIDYDVDGFFNNGDMNPNPSRTLQRGLAVCSGYSALYKQIALEAGLECVEVSGHGKGYGFTPLRPDEPVPPDNPTGHAWNAVRIDHGEWKLLDACWGAGSLDNGRYKRHFSPINFTESNDEFGLRHFPQDHRSFYRADGSTVTWEAYVRGRANAEPVTVYGTASNEGLSTPSFSPPQKHLSTSDGQTVVRFQCSYVCPHWDGAHHGAGQPYFLVLDIQGVDGRNKDMIPMETNGFWFWADVYTRDLGCAGQKVSIMAVTSVNGQDARGLSPQDYLSSKGRCGMGFAGIAAWELV